MGGMGVDGRTLVTKNSFRFLNTPVHHGAVSGAEHYYPVV
ncbi:hypothetical protein MJ699_11025 [Klebsiella pneumoniae]|nr:hypothetical protein MJ699_11025 [Klebsiella pneumoniae]